jgi:hypothetical protein
MGLNLLQRDEGVSEKIFTKYNDTVNSELFMKSLLTHFACTFHLHIRISGKIIQSDSEVSVHL